MKCGTVPVESAAATGYPAFAGYDDGECGVSDIKAIDCDVHPSLPDIKLLLPHLEEYWRDSVVERGIGSLETAAYPPNAPLTARPDSSDVRATASEAPTIAAADLGSACGNCRG